MLKYQTLELYVNGQEHIQWHTYMLIIFEKEYQKQASR